MAFTRPFLLCLGFFYVVRALHDFYVLPPPRLEVEPNYPVPRGAPLLLRCPGPDDSVRYRFYKEALEEALALEHSCWDSATPTLRHANATALLAGRYRCQYDFHSFWSQLSPPGDVPVAGFYEKPFLWAKPGLVVPLGHSVTFHCNSSVGLDKFVLYHGTPERGFQTLAPHRTVRNEAFFPFYGKTGQMNGQYRCYGYMSSEPHLWSAASDILVLSGGGLPPGCRNAVLLHVVLALATLGGLGPAQPDWVRG